MNIDDLIKNDGATLVDVRSVDEFEEGSVAGAINIPLHTIPARVEEFKAMKQPIICFCRSGNRSYQAVSWLKQHGIEAVNGGGVDDVMIVANQ